MLDMGNPDERQTTLTRQIFESNTRIIKIVDDLLDITRARFGSGLPVIRDAMDMGIVSGQLVDEMRAAYPTRTINLEISDNLEGEWDKARIGQVLSNLLGNAVQYSFQDSPITVIVKGTKKEVILSVHNSGIPIPPEKIDTLFDALTRASIDSGDHPETVNLGLGLYITEEIVISHGGKINVTSTEEAGTTFIAHFPRSA
jgi:signal transduction histidine kinase